MRLRIRLASVFATALCGCCLLVAAAPLGFAQAAPTAAPTPGTVVSPSATYEKLLSGMEKEFVDLAEAMPAEKYDFAPPVSFGDFKGVRTFAQQVKHVAVANEYYFHDPATPLVDNRAEIEGLKTKAEIVKELKDSFGEAHKYVAAITAENAFVMTQSGTRAGMTAFGIAHFMDHYGQLVEYLRMNGIVPPASRGAR